MIPPLPQIQPHVIHRFTQPHVLTRHYSAPPPAPVLRLRSSCIAIPGHARIQRPLHHSRPNTLVPLSTNSHIYSCPNHSAPTPSAPPPETPPESADTPSPARSPAATPSPAMLPRLVKESPLARTACSSATNPRRPPPASAAAPCTSPPPPAPPRRSAAATPPKTRAPSPPSPAAPQSATRSETAARSRCPRPRAAAIPSRRTIPAAFRRNSPLCRSAGLATSTRLSGSRIRPMHRLRRRHRRFPPLPRTVQNPAVAFPRSTSLCSASGSNCNRSRTNCTAPGTGPGFFFLLVLKLSYVHST